MKEMKSLMACIDLSDFTRDVIESALLLQKGQKTEILLLNVINSQDLADLEAVNAHSSSGLDRDSYIEQQKAERYDKIQELIENHFPSKKEQLKIRFKVGIPFSVILDAIVTEHIDLVVLANKGRSNLIGTLHGSCAEKVFRHSPVPVFSVRDREMFTENRLNRSRLAGGI